MEGDVIVTEYCAVKNVNYFSKPKEKKLAFMLVYYKYLKK